MGNQSIEKIEHQNKQKKTSQKMIINTKNFSNRVNKCK